VHAKYFFHFKSLVKKLFQLSLGIFFEFVKYYFCNFKTNIKIGLNEKNPDLPSRILITFR